MGFIGRSYEWNSWQKVRVTADTLYAWIRSCEEVTEILMQKAQKFTWGYFIWIIWKLESGVVLFQVFFLSRAQYFALFCVVHSQIAQDGSIWRGLYFAENPNFFFFFGFNFVVIFFLKFLRCLIFFLRNRPFFFTHRRQQSWTIM